ncbi:MAG: polyhydroxyalkanoic acid system family protein [Myxococcales bacterium]|nr:polyhydroxyalkanoic acid system family protein [Myxococcales bacterium]
MPKIQYRHDHSLDSDESRRRIQDLFERFGAKYRFRTRWTSDTLAEVSGRGVRGSVSLADGRVDLRLDLPFYLAPFASRIESGMTRELAKALD